MRQNLPTPICLYFSINRKNTPGLLWLSTVIWHCLLEPNSAWYSEVSPTQRQPLPLNVWCTEVQPLDPWCKMGSYIFQVCYLLQTSSFPFERNNAGFRQAPSHWETCLDSRTPGEHINQRKESGQFKSGRSFQGLWESHVGGGGSQRNQDLTEVQANVDLSPKRSCKPAPLKNGNGSWGLTVSNSWGIYQLCTW